MDEMRAEQFSRIQRLVRHAYANVPFYHDLYAGASFEPDDLRTRDDFERLPVISKDDVIAAYPDRILRKGVPKESLRVTRSSGSSGKVIDIAFDQNAMSVSVIAGLRLYRMGCRYRPWHRRAYIYSSPYHMRSLFGLYPLQFISTLTPIAETVEILNKSRPDLLVCYPSHLKQIAQAMQADGRGPRGMPALTAPAT